MRITSAPFGAALRATLAATCAVALVAACSPDGGTVEDEQGTIVTEAPEDAEALTEPEPRTEEPCPYLDEQEASELNGEMVSTVRIDDTLEPAACFFFDADGDVQFSTTVYDVGSERQAQNLVDGTVPVDSSEDVEFDGGWIGGRSGGPSGGIVAVTRDTQVFVAHTRQEQSVKAERIAELALSRIG